MKVKITKCPMAEDGLQVEGDQATPISDSMVMLGGKTHEQGGTDISYNGQQVEAEKGEPVSIGSRGEAIVWGNMNVPGTSKKFKTVAKNLGEKEQEYTELNAKAQKLLATNSPDSKFQRLGWNSGRVMEIGSLYGQKDVNNKMEQLSGLQKALLQTAQDNNLDPQELSKGNLKKAKKGAYIPYKHIMDNGGDPFDPLKRKGYIPNANTVTADIYNPYSDAANYGDPVPVRNPVPPANVPDNVVRVGPAPTKDGRTRSDRNNNPGNIKYGKFAKQIDPNVRQDTDGFAVFSSPEVGHGAMQSLLTGNSYKNLPVKDALTKWTGGKPYDLSGLGDLQGKKVSDLSPDELSNVMNYMQKGEGTSYGMSNPSTFAKNTPVAGGPNPYTSNPYTYTEKGLPTIDITPDAPQPTPEGATPPNLPNLSVLPNRPMPTNAQALDLKQILPEIYGYAQNKEVPVALQKYTPQMYVPYQMSFQDQINDNTSTLNSLSRNITGNPAYASALGAQAYDANNKVRANEFRTNQGIQADTINKNIALNNDAQLKNLQLADTQFVRQSEAKSRTKEINQAIMNSIASKYQQNSLQNKTLQAYENLYNYRFSGDNGHADYYGPDASYNYNGGGGNNNQADPNARVIRDKNGNIIRTVTQPLDVQQGQQYLNQERARKLSLLNNFYKNFNLGQKTRDRD